MKAVTLDGLDHYVWEYEPDWGGGVTGTFSFEADTVASLTVRERRAPMGETLRAEFQAGFLLNGAEAAEARNVLRILQDTPVRLPFWPGIGDGGASFGHRWFMAFDEALSPCGTQNLYFTNAGNDLSGRGAIVGTLLGYFSKPATFEVWHDELFRLAVQWKESSGFAEALQLAAVEWTQGPAIGARVIYQFPFMPSYEVTQDAGAVDVVVDRQNLGFSRSYSSAAYPQIGSRQPKFVYKMVTQADAATLLRFFQDQKGTAGVFWLPCWVGECRLAADAAAADLTVTVTDSTALGDQRYLQFFGPTGAVVTRKVTVIAGNVLTLDSALGIDLPADDTVLCTLALARFASADLTIKWTGPDLAEAAIQFAEVSQEYFTPAGEVMGGTLGALQAAAYLYQLNTAGLSFYWTSFEKALSYAGNDYAAEAIEHDEITDGLAWDASDCAVKTRLWAGNPLLSLVNRTATDRMEIIIAKGVPAAGAEPGAVTNYAVVFRGFVMQADMEGPWITAKAKGFGSLFTRNVPRTILQTSDNFALFDAGNRLLLANWTFTARLTVVAGNVLTFDTVTWPGGPLPAGVSAANYFALGYLQRPLLGGGLERVPIVASTAIAGGVLTVTMAHGFMNAAPVPPEAGWKLIPGYDGLFATATAKFANGVNFGGFPFMPDVNPSLVPMPTNTTPSSKKG